MESRGRPGLPEIENIMTDAGYRTEENYDYLSYKPFGNYLKHPYFYKETKGKLPLFSK